MSRLAELAVEIFRPRQEQVAKERAKAAEQARLDEQAAREAEQTSQNDHLAQMRALGQKIADYERRHPAPVVDPETRALNDAAASRAILIAKAAEGLRKQKEEKLRVKAAKRLRKLGL